MIDPIHHRRAFLSQGGISLGGAALMQLTARDASASNDQANAPARSDLPHHAPKAKRVIFLCMAGGPSHLETFDEKPALSKLDGKPMPPSYTAGQPIAQLQGQELNCLGALTKFGRYGSSGQTISDFLPWHQKMADDICVIRSMVTDDPNHPTEPSVLQSGALKGLDPFTPASKNCTELR